ncbi:MAG TPA: diphosphomevalonate decarboxylase [Anaerolineales bacterium]|nr:diphosphomevalonate decarboxylase [Anaerolineales bacterium]HRQ91729.1 diphosphomevalonate decarboxylase [Anaerolineales bacterium]
MSTASAIAHPNIAFIKYWGNRNHALRLPANGSISMNLAGLETRTTVRFDAALPADALVLNNAPAAAVQVARVSGILDLVRGMAGISHFAEVTSSNNFPSGSGIASSSSAFAALALAASAAAGLQLDEAALSRLARRGSGSASRSVPAGFVEWRAADTDEDSYAVSVAGPQHWDLVDTIAIISEEHKVVGSTAGHPLADSSPLQAARLVGAEQRLAQAREAILQRDLAALAAVMEFDNHLMHAVMMTSQPPLLYWQPPSLAVMQAVPAWRAEGLQAGYTLDAGPNVHVLSAAADAAEVAARLAKIPGVLRVLQASAGGAAALV